MRENLREHVRGYLNRTAVCAMGLALIAGAAATAEVRLQGYPDPFSTETEIRIELPHAGRVTLTLFDAMGREMRTVLDEERSAGTVTLRLSADELRNGRYTATLAFGKRRQSLAVVVVR